MAERLAAELGAVILNKDAVRAVLFPPPVLDYSAEQDDLCMRAIYAAAAHVLRKNPLRAVILDGRTFSRSDQVRDLLALAASVGETPRIIECVCADAIARRRLEDDETRGGHPAGNRTFALYLARKAAAEPLPDPRLVIDTGATNLAECVQRCLAWLRGG